MNKKTKPENIKFLIFGTGDYYERYKKWFTGKTVLALLDNSPQKQHRRLDGRRVLPPEEGVRLPFDVVVILSFYVAPMREQLLDLGVSGDRICHFYGLRRFFSAEDMVRPVWYGPGALEMIKPEAGLLPQERVKVLLLSQDLTLGGPSIALFHGALVLKDHGYDVVYASMTDGVLKTALEERNIPVVIDENLQLAVMAETEWISGFSVIICNTLNFHVFLSERDTGIPVIWWLHDAQFFYDGAEPGIFRRISVRNLKAVSVGPVPAAAIREFLPWLDCGELLYGVSDERTENRELKDPAKTRFVTIGFLEDIKGQDILVKAFRKLPEHVRHGCECFLVGHDGTLFGEQVHRECAGMEEVVFTGTVDRKTIHRLLETADVLVCPSRQDAMPTVAAEAMMHGVACIVSDVTGTAAYIQDGTDGFVVPSGDDNALAARMLWCVEHKTQLEDIGKRARRLYEKHFSMPVFEKRLLGLVREMCLKTQTADGSDSGFVQKTGGGTDHG